MRVGTKSVLFGAHCFLFHWFFVFLGWWRLYGFPWDPRLWIAFVIHDLGYWSLPNMDGPEGESHPVWAANIMGRLFGKKWYYFCLCHSRYWCRKIDKYPSKLCYADKLAIALEPWWLYIPRAWLSGEIHEYMRDSNGSPGAKYNGLHSIQTNSKIEWFKTLQKDIRKWVKENKKDE